MMLHLSIAIVVVLVALVGLSRAFLAAPTMLSRNHYPLALLPASKCCRLAATSKRDPSTEEPQKQGGGFFGAIGGFFEELDAFMDDASYVTLVAFCKGFRRPVLTSFVILIALYTCTCQSPTTGEWGRFLREAAVQLLWRTRQEQEARP